MMDVRIPFSRVALGILTTAWALGLTPSAHAATRMYTGSLVIHAFGNDTTTGSFWPYTSETHFGIPLTGQCNTGQYHAPETLTFPTMEKSPPTQTVMFTIPAYGGQVVDFDIDGDTIPDIPAGCTSVSQGDPLTGSGLVATTGALSTSRTPLDPRGFALPRSVLHKVKTGASLETYGVYAWEVHFADLHNEAASFAKNGGDGSFAVSHTRPRERRKAIQAAGKNKFGGVMRLLGSYGDNEGYVYNNLTTSVFYFDWLFDYLGHGGQLTDSGVVTAAYTKTRQNYGYLRANGSRGTSTVYAEVFKWTTGTVTVTALGGTFPTILRRKGYDNRTAMGSGAVQLVSPMLTHWVGAGESSTAAIGIMKVTFMPEPNRLTLLGVGISMLGVLFCVRRRSRRIP
jgi:hypothetical protein